MCVRRIALCCCSLFYLKDRTALKDKQLIIEMLYSIHLFILFCEVIHLWVCCAETLRDGERQLPTLATDVFSSYKPNRVTTWEEPTSWKHFVACSRVLSEQLPLSCQLGGAVTIATACDICPPTRHLPVFWGMTQYACVVPRPRNCYWIHTAHPYRPTDVSITWWRRCCGNSFSRSQWKFKAILCKSYQDNFY